LDVALLAGLVAAGQQHDELATVSVLLDWAALPVGLIGPLRGVNPGETEFLA
jgi:hypothetical protein